MEPDQEAQGSRDNIGSGGSALGSILKKRLTLAVLSVVISAVIAIATFFMFLPLKLEHMMKNFAQKFGGRTEQVIEKRSDRAFEYYLSKVVVQKLRGAGSCKTGLCNPNINTGNPMADVIRNWQADRFEDKLAKNQGIRFVLNKDTNKVRILRHGQNVGQFDADKGFKFDSDLKNAQSRSIIKRAVKNETKWHQVYQRRHMRDLLRTKYGVVKWRVFEKTREKAGDKAYLAKRKLRQSLIDNVSKPALAKTPLYFRCLIEGCSASSLNSDVDPHGIDERNRVAALANADGACDRTTASSSRCTGRQLEGNNPTEGQDSEAQNQARDQIRNSDGGGSDDGTGLTDSDSVKSDNEIKEVVQKTLTKKILASLGTGLGIAEIISQINRAVEDDLVGDIIENRNKLQYARVYTLYRTMIDQFKEGTVESEDVNAMMAQIDGLENSKLYAKDFDIPYRNNTAFGGSAHAADSKPECDDGSNIAASEVICQDKKVRPSGRYSEVYKNSPMFISIRAIAAAYDATVGKVFKWVIEAVGVIAGPIVNTIMELPGIKEIFGAAANLIERIFNHFFGINITGAEEEGEAYNGMRIGSDVVYNDTCRFSLGCTQVSAAKAASIDKQISIENSYGQSFFAKLFNTDNNNSLTSRFIALMPSGPKSFTNQTTLAFSNPLGVLNFQKVFALPASAVTSGTRDEVGVVQMAYDLENPQHKKYLELPIDDLFWDNCEKFNKDWTDQINKDPDATPSVTAYDGTVVVGINPCRANFVSAESLKSTSTDKDDGGIGSLGQQECQTNAPPTAKRIFFLGDSIIVGARDNGDLRNKLRLEGLSGIIDGSNGRSITSGGTTGNRLSGLDAIEENKEEIRNAGAIIVELGTNRSGNADAFESQAADLINNIQKLNNTAPIYWVEIFANKTNYDAYNTALKKVIQREARDQSITLIPTISEDIELSSDKIHPTPDAGYPKFASVLADALSGETDVVLGGDCDESGVATVSGDIQELAKKLQTLATQGKIRLITLNSADEQDRSTPKLNIEDTASGKVARTTQTRRCTAPQRNATNKSTTINANVLRFLIDYSEKVGGLGVTALVGQCHSATSNHYKGIAVDIDCNGANASKMDEIAAKYKGADNGERCDTGDNHYHYDFKGN